MKRNSKEMTYYAVRIGRNPGIYMTWDSARKEVDGFKGADFKSFKNIKDAETYLKCQEASKPLSNVMKRLLDSYKSHPDYNKSLIVNIYTDGSTINNGQKDASGGYGVFIPETKNVGDRLIVCKLVGEKITNGVAELKAMYKAFVEIKEMSDINMDQEYVIYYDSTYAADVITKKKKARTNIEIIAECHEILDEIKQKCKISFKHVYSHTGNKDLHSIGNEIADKLAGGDTPPGVTY